MILQDLDAGRICFLSPVRIYCKFEAHGILFGSGSDFVFRRIRIIKLFNKWKLINSITFTMKTNIFLHGFLQYFCHIKFSKTRTRICILYVYYKLYSIVKRTICEICCHMENVRRMAKEYPKTSLQNAFLTYWAFFCRIGVEVQKVHFSNKGFFLFHRGQYKSWNCHIF